MKRAISLLFFLFLFLTGMAQGLLRHNTATISNGQTFTTNWERCYNFPSVTTNTFSDQDVSLFVDFTNDQVNVDSSIPYDITQNINEVHRITTTRGYVRLRIVNNSGSTAMVRWGYILGDQYQLTSSISSAIQADADALVVRSIPTDSDVAFGQFQGFSQDNKSGFSPSLGTTIKIGDTTTWVNVWNSGGLRTTPTSTFTPFMASTASADTDVPIEWVYQDTNGNQLTVTVNTNASNGTTPVSLGVTATEVYDGHAHGNIDGTVSVATANNFSSGTPASQAQKLASINPDDNEVQMAAGRVPLGYRRNVTHITMAMLRENGGTGSVIGVFQKRRPGSYVWETERYLLATDSKNYDQAESGIVLEALTDYRIIVRDVSGTATYVRAIIYYQDRQ